MQSASRKGRCDFTCNRNLSRLSAASRHAGFVQSDETSTIAEIEHLSPLRLVVHTTAGYPSTAPPTFVLSCHWLGKSQLLALASKLRQIWDAQVGTVVIYSWVEWLKSDSVDSLQVEHAHHNRQPDVRTHAGVVHTPQVPRHMPDDSLLVSAVLDDTRHSELQRATTRQRTITTRRSTITCAVGKRQHGPDDGLLIGSRR